MRSLVHSVARAAASATRAHRGLHCAAHATHARTAAVAAAIGMPARLAGTTLTATRHRAQTPLNAITAHAASFSAEAAPTHPSAPLAPTAPITPLPLTHIEFPYLRGEPASDEFHGLDFEHGTSVRDAPLLVLHGLLGSAMNWRTTAPKLTHRRKIISIDLRNHGGSPHSDDMRLQACAADVIALMDSKGIAKAVLLGHSLGGKVAMAAALLYPDRIAAVCSADMAPIRYDTASAGWSGVGSIVKACASVPIDCMHSRADVDTFLKPLIPDFTTRAFVMQNVVSTAATEGRKQRVHWRCNLQVLARALPWMAEFEIGAPLPPATGSGALQPFNGPALFVAGGRSSYLLDSHSPRLRELFPHHRMESIHDAGHWLHVEKPKEFVHIVHGWMHALEKGKDQGETAHGHGKY